MLKALNRLRKIADGAPADDALDDHDQIVLATVRSRYAIWRKEADEAVRRRLHSLAVRGLLIAHGAGAARRFTLSEAGRRVLGDRGRAEPALG